jgi:hypothetical protein
MLTHVAVSRRRHAYADDTGKRGLFAAIASDHSCDQEAGRDEPN